MESLDAIFLGARAIDDPVKRVAYLAEACGADINLRGRIETMLRDAQAADAFFAPKDNAIQTADVPLSEKPGTIIGRYKLLEKIGEGGMGVVYMAEQREPVIRKVALKIIKLGMDTRQVVARFEAERQALALMDHPNIAKVLDGGATESGRPYFVMELVNGLPITKFCDQMNLPTRGRLDLFLEVCSAIQHAHQKGIIHRDIKPSNILVTMHGEKPVPKVIDFGIAKATSGQQLTEKTLFTQFQHFIGTPAYVSPEQTGLSGLDIDTRSDVYSLGVLLYELLTGKTPFDGKELLKAGLNEMRRAICEDEPVKPSTRLTQERLATRSASSGKSEIRSPKSEIDNDLDWIVMKCLEKDRARRYETANGLAKDIERHLNSEPVVACPPSKVYQFQKLIRRNRLAFAAAGAVVVVLVLGIITSTWQALRATRAEHEQIRQRQAVERERNRAEAEAAKSEQVAKFLTDMLNAAGPSVARGRDASMLREILDKAAERVGRELKNQPEVQGDLWFTLGNTYADMGDYSRAVTNFQQAVHSYRAAFDDEHKKLALALGFMGRIQTRIGSVSTGKSNASAALEMARHTGDKRTIATCLVHAGRSLDQYLFVREGEDYLREAVAIERELGDDPVALGNALLFLGSTLSDTTPPDLPGWKSKAEEALALHRKHLGNDSFAVADDLYQLGQAFLQLGQLADARVAGQESVDIFRRILDKDHARLQLPLSFLGHVMMIQGDWHQAEALFKEVVESSPANSNYRFLLGDFYARRSQWDSAIEQFSKAADLKPDEVWGKSQLVILLARVGREEEYRKNCRLMLERFSRTREFGTADKVAKAALLLPMEGDDFQRACELADFAATATGPAWALPWFAFGKALAELRRGKYESADEWSGRALSDEAVTPQCKAASFYVRAAAMTHLNRIASARTALAAGDVLVAESKAMISGDHGGDWPDWTIADLLRRETLSLIESRAAPAQEQPSDGDERREGSANP